MSKYQLLPPLTESEYEALREDIAVAGVLVPIDVTPDGHVLDGHHRQKACAELGIDCPERVVDIPEFARFDYALTVNLARRHLDRAQRRQLVWKSVKDAPNLSDRQHARRCGVSPSTVAEVRKDLEAADVVSKLDTRRDKRGREQPATKPVKTADEQADAGLPPASAPEQEGLDGPAPDRGSAPSTDAPNDVEAGPSTNSPAPASQGVQPTATAQGREPGSEPAADERTSAVEEPQADRGSPETGDGGAANAAVSGPQDAPRPGVAWRGEAGLGSARHGSPEEATRSATGEAPTVVPSSASAQPGGVGEPLPDATAGGSQTPQVGSPAVDPDEEPLIASPKELKELIDEWLDVLDRRIDYAELAPLYSDDELEDLELQVEGFARVTGLLRMWKGQS